MLGAVPIRAYALCIIVGIVAATWLGERRWRQRGGEPGVVSDLLVWAVPAGVVGARAYHVVTNPELYFADGRDPVRMFYIWNGGLGIWGAVMGGGVAVYVVARRRGLPFADLADAIAPCLALAQAIGRVGNWFNQELFGRPTDLPWGLRIDPENRPSGYEHVSTFHPTFLYEAGWNLFLVWLLLAVDRRARLNSGGLFALYVMGYTVGRAWIEYLRIDPANDVLGLRLNEWTSLALFIAAAAYLFVARSRSGGRMTPQHEVSQLSAPDAPPPHERPR